MPNSFQDDLSFSAPSHPELEKRLKKSFLLSIPDIAEAVNFSPESIEAWIEVGALPVFTPPNRERKHKRVLRSDFIAFWNRHYSNHAGEVPVGKKTGGKT